MIGKFFGQFLFEKRRLSRRQLMDALYLQERTNKPLGLMALELGFLNHEEVQQILELQKEQDETFGNIALSLGLMTREQLGVLLQAQNEHHLLLGEALVQQGLLDYEELTELLHEFHQANADLAAELGGLLEEIEPRESLRTVLLTVQRFLTRILSGKVKVTHLEPECRNWQPLFRVCLSLFDEVGRDSFCYVMLMDKRFLHSLVYCLLSKQTSSPKLIDETLREMCRDMNASIVNQMLTKGRQLSPHPPQIHLDTPIDGPCFILSAPTGQCRLIFQTEAPIEKASGFAEADSHGP